MEVFEKQVVVIPWTETVIDPLGNERDVTLDVEVPVVDIWKWRRFYMQGENPLVPRERKKEKVDKEKLEKLEDGRGSRDHRAKIGISRRLTGIEAWKKSDSGPSRAERIVKLVETLKKSNTAELSELVIHNNDRLCKVANMPDTTAEDKEFLVCILKA